MVEQNWRLLHVDDDPDEFEKLQDFFRDDDALVGDRQVTLAYEEVFESALSRLEQEEFDLVVLDILDNHPATGETPIADAGLRLFSAIKERQFVPVVFFSGVSERARAVADKHHLVRLVTKDQGGVGVMKALTELVDTGLHEVDRVIHQQLQDLHRSYMWDFVSPQWGEFDQKHAKAEFAYLLSRRYAMALSGTFLSTITSQLGVSDELDLIQRQPMMYYIMPPIDNGHILPGDIFATDTNGEASYSILITPSCDLIQRKAKNLVLCKCQLITDHELYIQHQNHPSKNKRGKIAELLRNKRSSHHFLPPAGELPGLVVDFERVVSICATAFDADGTTRRVASLDSPFREELVNRFSQHFGRIGTADLDKDQILSLLGV